MSFAKEISNLLQAGVISPETADRIEEYYQHQEDKSPNKLFILFGIFGSALIGLGIILILAHNWDDLSKTVKTIFAFLPLLIGQFFCGYTLVKKSQSTAWRESTATFLFFAVGASIALVSQIYNLEGELSSFLLTWMLLCLPLIYLMKSSVVSLLYLIGITQYAISISFDYRHTIPYLYAVLFLLALPHYYLLFKNRFGSNFMSFHNWFIPLSLTAFLSTLADSQYPFIVVSFMSLFGIFYLIGNSDAFKNLKLRNNGFRIIGALGTVGLLLNLSFDWFWKDIKNESFSMEEILSSPEFITALVLTLLGFVLLILILNRKGKSLNNVDLLEFVFLFFIIIFIIGLNSFFAVILVNILLFLVGILTIRKGANQNHLGIINYGLLIISALIMCRFFDTDISFIIRGILFISLGIGFFLTNYWMLKKRKENG